MNITDLLQMFSPSTLTALVQRPMLRNTAPASFRRGYRNHRIIGYVSDPNSLHGGKFRGGITPMKRRAKGVSRTANKA